MAKHAQMTKAEFERRYVRENKRWMKLLHRSYDKMLDAIYDATDKFTEEAIVYGAWRGQVIVSRQFLFKSRKTKKRKR